MSRVRGLYAASEPHERGVLEVGDGHQILARDTRIRFRLCSARLVTHYRAHGRWLEEGAVLHGASWPQSELTLIDAEGHGGGTVMNDAIISATDAFATHGTRPA